MGMGFELKRADKSNDVYVWLCAFVPFIYLTVSIILQSPEWLPFLLFVANLSLLGVDAYKLDADGFDVDKWMIAGLIFLVPLYLFRRARVVNGTYSYAVVWLLSYLLVFVVPYLVVDG